MDSNFNDTAEEEDHQDEPLVTPAESLDEDLYACLNVSKTATSEEITAAYRRFSRIYHPDKVGQNPADKEKAEQLFSRIKKAHEILLDPSKRAIYDSVGLEAFESQGLELVERYETATEIRDAYERLKKERQDEEIERRTNPKGSIVTSINCSEIFNPYASEDDAYYADASYVEITGFQFSQSIEAPLNSSDTLLMSGMVSSVNGRGNGSITSGIRRTVSNRTWVELCLGGSTSGLDFGLKGFHQFGQRFFFNSSVLVRKAEEGVGGAFVFGVGNQVDAKTVATLTWRNGERFGSLVGGCTRDDGVNRIGVTLHLGIPHIYSMIQTSHKHNDAKFRFNAKVGTFGAFIEYGIEKKISQYSTLAAQMVVGVPHGVILRLKIIRSNQNYIFPIHLSDELVPSAIVYGTIAPFLIYFILKKQFLEPYETKKAKNEKEKKQAAYKNKMAKKRAEAEAAVELMRNTYERIRTEEEAKNGLTIETAIYGRIATGSDESERTEEEVIDVTIALQCLVRDSCLHVQKGSKVHLLGFYDPSPGEKKSLQIQYRFKNIRHEVILQDEEEIKIPKRAHQLEEEPRTTP